MAYSNPFEAIGLDKDEATIAALRSDYASILRDWIKQRQLTQAAAGNILQVPQAVVSKIINGNVVSMSIEYLIKLLARADVAWTSRCWHAPADAAVCKGPAPASWIGTGTRSTSFERVAVLGAVASAGLYTDRPISAPDSRATGTASPKRIRIGG